MFEKTTIESIGSSTRIECSKLSDREVEQRARRQSRTVQSVKRMLGTSTGRG